MGALNGKPVSRLLPLLLVTLSLFGLPSWGCTGGATSSLPTTTNAIITPPTTSADLPETTAYVPPVVIATATSGPPTATILQQEVTLLDPLVLWNDYEKDPNAAALKYEGKVFRFAGVIVEQMSYLGEGWDTEYYVQTGKVKFRTENPYVIWPVRAGYTVDIVGTVTGLKWNYLNVMMSSIVVTDPPGGVGGNAPPPEY